MVVDVTNAEPAYRSRLTLEGGQAAEANRNVQARRTRENAENNNAEENNAPNNRDAAALNSNAARPERGLARATGVVEQADAALNEIENNLVEIRNNARRAREEDSTAREREELQREARNNAENINRIYENETYEEEPLLRRMEQGGLNFRVGENTNITAAFERANAEETQEANAEGLGVANANFETRENADNVERAANNAIDTVERRRGDLENVRGNINNIAAEVQNNANLDRDRIMNAENAREETVNVAELILENNEEATQSQANARYDDYIGLLRAGLIETQEEPE